MLGFDNIERVKPGGLELKDRLVAVNRVTKVCLLYTSRCV